MNMSSFKLIILYCLGAEALIFLYAQYIKTNSKSLAIKEGHGYSEVMYQSIILESYGGFTNLIYIVTLILMVSIGVKLNFKTAIWKWLIALLISVIFVFLNLYGFKFFW